MSKRIHGTRIQNSAKRLVEDDRWRSRRRRKKKEEEEMEEKEEDEEEWT